VDFFARQESARRTTRWLVLAYRVSVACIVVASDAVIALVVGTSSPGVSPRGPVIFASVVVIAIICGTSLFKTLALRSGGASVARSLGGTRIDRGTGDVALRRAYNVVEEMAIASGVTMPEVYVLEDEEGINAFAAGHSPADAAIALTRGAVTRLRREELQAVVAHEFSHILNGDSRLNLRLLGLTFGLLAIATIARLALQFGPRGHGRDDRKGGAGAIMLAALAIMVLGYLGVFFGRLLQAAVSRHRERRAEASAVQFTRNPQGLAGALLKIAGTSGGSHLNAAGADAVAHMLFAPGLDRMLSTHPPIGERLRALDRNFREENLPALAAEAARDAERLRAADADSAAAGPRAPAGRNPLGALERPVSLALGALGTLTDQVGELQDGHVRYAEAARLAIPQELREFADSADRARALLLALLASREPDVRARQREIVARVHGAEIARQVEALGEFADRLAPELRLPAVQQLFPALRRLARSERESLRDVVTELASADSHIDVFECCLSLLMAASLADELEAAAPHGDATLLDEAAAVRTLLAILAHHGADDAGAASLAYSAGLSVALPGVDAAAARVESWPRALGDALERHAHQRPLEKNRLIDGQTRCVAFDGKLSIEEGELLRTVCAVLNCPLPPLLTAGAAARELP
jgi:Zn-dependent protease with chaperone function